MLELSFHVTVLGSVGMIIGLIGLHFEGQSEDASRG